MLTSAAAISRAREYSESLADAPASANYARYTAPVIDAGTAESAALAVPIWAVGFSNLSIQLPGGLAAPGASPVSALITGRIIFVGDLTNATELALDCPS